MRTCFFASDLHGRKDRYEKLFRAIVDEQPAGVFLGGDLFPGAWGMASEEDFFEDVLVAGLRGVRGDLGDAYPTVFLILGNDDAKAEESAIVGAQSKGLWIYAHERSHPFHEHTVYGYSYTPPSPFQMKDWEKYDVGRYVPPGCVSPEEGMRTVEEDPRRIRFGTISEDLKNLLADDSLEHAILLFHGPPHDTCLDRVDQDGKMIDHVPLDVNVGSIAMRRLIDEKQPYITLHGHIHESAALTGAWRQRLGRTFLFGAAHDGPELALVRFDLDHPDQAERSLL